MVACITVSHTSNPRVLTEWTHNAAGERTREKFLPWLSDTCTRMMMMQEDKRCKDGKRTHQAVNQRHIDMLIDITRYPLLRPLYAPYIWMLKLKKQTTKCKTMLLESSLSTWSWVSVKFVNIVDNDANKDNIVLELTSSVVTISGSRPSMLV